jgi:hypothetical protein
MSDERFPEGQDVFVFNVNRQKGEVGLPGRVIKAGRTLAHVLREGWDDPRYAEKFDLETGRSQDGFSWIMTPEDIEDQDKRRAALAMIRAYGFEPTNRNTGGRLYSTGELEDIALRVASFGPV